MKKKGIIDGKEDKVRRVEHRGGERKEKEEKKYPELPGFFRWL